MSRKAKIITASLAAACVGVVLAFIAYVRVLSGPSDESTWETTVTPEFVDSMRRAGFPITVTRVVSASSYGGWHGDGQQVTAYRYSPDETEELIAALQKMHPDFSWSETRAEFVARYAPWTLLPRDMQPRDASLLEVGHPRNGLALQEYVLDRSHAILYSVSNRF